MDHLKAKTADLAVRWQEVHGLAKFQTGVEALVAGDPTPITLLIKGVECNKEFAKKLTWERQASDFQPWLSQAKLRGHSGIYKCLKAPDNVHPAFSECPSSTTASFCGSNNGMEDGTSSISPRRVLSVRGSGGRALCKPGVGRTWAPTGP